MTDGSPNLVPEMIPMDSVPFFQQRILSNRAAFAKICGQTPIPRFRKARQQFPKDRVTEVRAAVREAVAQPGRLTYAHPTCDVGHGIQ